MFLLVMGSGLGPARARPGARVFCRARGPTFGEGLKPGPARARSKKPGGFEGLLKDDFFEKKPLLFLDSLLKNVHILNANHSFCPISVF